MSKKKTPKHIGFIPSVEKEWFNPSDDPIVKHTLFLINPKNVIWVNFLEDRQWEGEKFSKFNVKFIDGSEKELFFKENEYDTLLSGRNKLRD